MKNMAFTDSECKHVIINDKHSNGDSLPHQMQ